MGQDSSGEYTERTSADKVLKTQVTQVTQARSQIEDLEFRRSPEGEGRLVLALSDPSIDVNVFSEGGNINLEFMQTSVPETLLRRFDVTDFATPVNSVEVSTTERGARLLLKASGNFDYLAYQTGNEYVLSVKPLSSEEKQERLNEFNYVGRPNIAELSGHRSAGGAAAHC